MTGQPLLRERLACGAAVLLTMTLVSCERPPDRVHAGEVLQATRLPADYSPGPVSIEYTKENTGDAIRTWKGPVPLDLGLVRLPGNAELRLPREVPNGPNYWMGSGGPGIDIGPWRATWILRTADVESPTCAISLHEQRGKDVDLVSMIADCDPHYSRRGVIDATYPEEGEEPK